MNFKHLFIAIMIAGFAIGCSDSEENNSAGKVISLNAEQGKTVFELLQAKHDVEYSQAAMGVFIKSIDGIKNEGGHFWIYYVNGKAGQIACDKFIVSEGDEIEWRYE